MNEEDELQKLWDIGPRAHVATNFDFVSENEQMQILLKQEVLNQAEKLKCQIRYVDYKLKSIHDFIESLPCAFHSWALVRKTSAQSMEADLESPLQPVEATLGVAGTAVPSPRGPKPSKSGRARRAAVVTLSNGESIEEANKKAAQSYFPEPNRLQFSLTAEVVREICQHIYDSVLVVNPQWNLRIGSVEAALLAWDLTSQIHGCCRIPVTLVTQREGRQYTFIFIVLMVEDQFALLGKYLLKELCFLPLRRQKLSDVVDRVGDILSLRDHSLSTLYLGLPTDGTSAPDESPTVWRVLKLSCRRQEWHSVLAACDFYMARRQQVREIISEVLLSQDDPEQGHGYQNYKVSVPQGLALWTNSRGEVRLKVTEPLLVRKRIKKIPKKVMRGPRGGVAAMDKKSVAALSMKMGAMEQKHPNEQEVWHHLAFSRQTMAANSAASAAEWPLVQESECSSLSSASLDEYAEDFCIDRHQTRPVFQALN